MWNRRTPRVRDEREQGGGEKSALVISGSFCAEFDGNGIIYIIRLFRVHYNSINIRPRFVLTLCTYRKYRDASKRPGKRNSPVFGNQKPVVHCVYRMRRKLNTKIAYK